ncbi:DUF4240 domain-containing protein [Pendulispora brunnea]|uniref:DUF4240 domain-containing protein n=1 Tax=Pendulispora brunnea TaxID=2905690 RepID=A0ABZ2KAL7_9BACT
MATMNWSNTAMSESVFWQIIGLFNWNKTGDDDEIVAPAVGALSRMRVEDIEKFDDILAEKLFALDTEAHARNIGEESYVDEDSDFSVDLFLYARCCAVANGKSFFEEVLAHPEKMPKDMEFESILNLAGDAYVQKTGEEFEHTPSTSYETFSNRTGWAREGESPQDRGA